MNTHLILLMQLASTAFMCGLIWLVQLLVYPNFSYIHAEKFKSFHSHHTGKITWIVAPVMLIELICAAVLLYFNSESFFILNFLSVALVWLQTAFINIPIHNSLARGYYAKAATRLVQLNWLRTAVWSFRLVLLLYYLTNS